MRKSAEDFDADHPERCYDAILADIDHAPGQKLYDSSDSFYQIQGLRMFTRHFVDLAISADFFKN